MSVALVLALVLLQQSAWYRRLPHRGAAASILAVSALLTLEGSLALYVRHMAPSESEYVFCPELLWRPSHRRRRPGTGDGALRDKGERFRILCVGDSATWGGGGLRNSWPGMLQGRLSGGGFSAGPDGARKSQTMEEKGLKVDVINAAVPGYSSFQIRRWVELELGRVAPDLLLVGLSHNDTLREAMDDASRVGPPPVRWLRHSILYLLLRRLLAPLHPPVVPGRIAAVERVSPQDRVDNYRAIALVARLRKIPVAFVVMPKMPPRQSYQDDMVRVAREMNVPVLDADARWPRQSARPLFEDNVHLTAAGLRLLAKEVATFLLREELLCRVHGKSEARGVYP